MGWWQENNIRMIQNNTRDIDAAMDVDKWVQELKDFDCNVAMVGVGGVTSFFPTRLKYQVVSPYLPEGRDLIGEMIEKCHAAGIRFIGRFDFGRVHEKFQEEHPEWLYRSAKGQLLRCADTLTTCISSWYQREYSLEIVREAMETYPGMDGIFFNAFGFAGWDYYGNQFGPCHCEGCKKLYREFSGGLDIPNSDSPEEKGAATYQAFQRHSIAEALARIHALVKSINPETCLCTYSPDNVDMIRSETNTGIGRPNPIPLMNASNNQLAARYTWPDRPLASCVINAVDLRWRYTGVSPELNKIRLWETLASGGMLDFCINGVFEGYPDQNSLTEAKEVFHYAARNERYYGHLDSKARVLVVREEGSRPIHDGSAACFGLMKILKEEHIPIDMMADGQLEKEPALAERFDLVIWPDVRTASGKAIAGVKGLGKKVMALTANRPLKEETAAALGVQIASVESDNAGAYVFTREKEIFRHFARKDWVMLTEDIGFAGDTDFTPLLPYIARGEFGPAERAYGTRLTEQGSVLVSPDEKTIVVPWAVTALFHKYGYADHKYIIADLIDRFAPETRILKTDAHPCVELFWDANRDGLLLQAVNMSGFNGMTVEKALPIYDIRVEVPVAANRLTDLHQDGITIEQMTEKTTVVRIARLDRYAAALIQ
ncbi:MAG: hypothetical protein IKN04_14455 [Clostridia bacterium]|nr:hypothetical protein [Clostridia bacterium]